MTHFDLAQTIIGLSMIRDPEISSVRLSENSKLETIDEAIEAIEFLMHYLPRKDRNYINDLLEESAQ